MRKQSKYVIGDGVTSSMLLTWLQCRQAARFYINGWQSARLISSAQFGTCVHAMLRWVYDEIGKEWTPKMRHDDLIANAMFHGDRFFDLWRTEQARKLSSADAIAEVENNIITASALLPHYFNYWPDEFHRHVDWDLETMFDLDFRGFRLRGKRDGIFKGPKGKSLWLLETKTKSRIEDADNLEWLSFDFQSLFYTLATQAATKQKLQGICYNVIRRPQLRQKQTESPEAFAARLREDIGSRPEFYFVRYYIEHPQNEISVFHDDLLTRLEEFKLWVEGDRPTFKSESACLGRWTCRYLHACATGSMDGYIQRPLFGELNEE